MSEEFTSAGGDNIQPNVNKITASGSSQTESGDSLEDLLTTLNSQIKSSDWLQKNTAEKWAAENPALAEEYKAAMKASSDGADGKDKTT